MLRFLSPFILFLPVLGWWRTGAVSFFMFLVLGVAFALVCLYQTGSRGRRTPQYEIMTRLYLTLMLPGLVFMYAFYGASWSMLWSTSNFLFWTLLMMLGFRWIAFTVGGAVLRDENMRRLEQSGFSFFWDTLPWPWNPDSDFVRAGGRPEPAYTNGFVPPKHWQYQCPRCGARWETNFGRCYNCDYGHDGRSDDYYALYPHERPQGQSAQPNPSPTPPPEEPPQHPGPYLPVEPRR